jgi:phosphocarrier protein
MSDPASGDGARPSEPSGDRAIVRVLDIINKKGLHARAAAKFVQTVEKFDAKVEVVAGDGEPVDGTSILDLLMLAAAPGTAITVKASGAQAQAAMDAVTALVSGGFGEED